MTALYGTASLSTRESYMWNETAGQWEEVRLAAGGSVTIGGVAFLPALTNHFSQFTVLSAIAAQSTTTPPPPATTPQPAPSSAPSSVEAPSACGPIPGPCEAAILTGSLIGGLFALAILAILVHIALRLMRPSPPFPAPTPKRDPPRFAPVGLAPAPSATYGSAGAPAQGGGAVGHTFLYSEGDEVSRGAGAAHPVEQARREFSPSVQGEHHPPPSVRADGPAPAYALYSGFA
ncbi:hypothetical protein T484DRAFT_1771490 [Baffinella frigidus]|nr:hypothetical protein T484DRAFT_1771490 [Cryptophyta sp. CCMP2293]